MSKTLDHNQTEFIPVHFLVLAISVFLIFAITIHNGFVYDDHDYVENNYQVKRLGNIPAIFRTSFPPNQPHIAFYRPLVLSSYAIDHYVWKNNPAGYHFTNVLIHLLNVFVVYAIVFMLLANAKISLVSALLFAVHPVHSEAVAWISGRFDLLSSMFCFLSVFLYIKSTRHKLRLRMGYLFLSILSFGMGLLAKEMAVVVIPLVILCDFVKRDSTAKNRLLNIARSIPAYLGYCIALAIVCYIRYEIIGGFAKTHLTSVFAPEDGVSAVVLTMAKVGVKYLQLTVFPIILTLVYEYDIVRLPLTFGKALPCLFFAGLLLAGLTLLILPTHNGSVRVKRVKENTQRLSDNAFRRDESVIRPRRTYRSKPRDLQVSQGQITDSPLRDSSEYLTTVCKPIKDFALSDSLTHPVEFQTLHLVGFAIVWFYISLTPVMNIVPVGEFLAERYLYFPSLGFCLIAGVLYYRIARKGKFAKVTMQNRILKD